MEDAFADQATGLANRTRFEQALMRMLADGESRFSLVYIEMHGYRDLNNTVGEQAARQMAQEFAAGIKAELTDAHSVARYSSSGFMAIVPELTESAVANFFARFKRSIAKSKYATAYGQWALGYSSYPATANNSRLLMRAAQKQRYTTDYPSAAA
jgi:diguanylate cyclase (GGDEF)-like protein